MEEEICRTIGYALPVRDFYQHVRFPIWEGRCLRGELEDYLPDIYPGLFIPVSVDQRIEHIMMYPTLSDREKWNRQNTFLLYGDATYMNVPIPPYDKVCMDGNGVGVNGPHGDDPALHPGIPAVMQWWLRHYGVFDLAGIAKIRPMVVEWLGGYST